MDPDELTNESGLDDEERQWLEENDPAYQDFLDALDKQTQELRNADPYRN